MIDECCIPCDLEWSKQAKDFEFGQKEAWSRANRLCQLENALKDNFCVFIRPFKAFFILELHLFPRRNLMKHGGAMNNIRLWSRSRHYQRWIRSSQSGRIFCTKTSNSYQESKPSRSQLNYWEQASTIRLITLRASLSKLVIAAGRKSI